MNLGIVVPCYNENDVLEETARRLLALRADLVEKNKIKPGSSIYLVDDGSTDRTWELIESIAAQNPPVVGIKLSRNRGHQNALLAGLMLAEGDALISMDADLQDDIMVVAEMVDEFLDGRQVVYGVRRTRELDTSFKRFTAESYYRLLRRMGVDAVFNHADFRLLGRAPIEALREYREVNLFLRGIVPLLGFDSAIVRYDRGQRFAGESKYPLRKMLAFAIEGITSFSAVPLRMITILGLSISLLSAIVVVWVLGVRLFTEMAVPGWASTILPIYFLGGVQLLGIGVIGEYLSKVYLEVKSRPRFVVERMTRIPIDTNTHRQEPELDTSNFPAAIDRR